MPSSIDDPSAGLLGDEEAPVHCHSAVRGVGVVTLAFGGLVVTNVCVLLFKELSQIDGEYLYNPASALCMAEIGKFLVSCCVRLATKAHYKLDGKFYWQAFCDSNFDTTICLTMIRNHFMILGARYMLIGPHMDEKINRAE